MSTPSDQASVSATSPTTRPDDIEDTASSIQGMGEPEVITVQSVHSNASPSSPRRIVFSAPNTVYSRRMRDTRSRSVSPRPRRVVSPSVTIAQLRARTAEWKADTAQSFAGRIADETVRAQSTAEDAIAEARAVREQVESRIADLTRRAEISSSSVLGEMTGRVKETVERSQEEMSRAVGSSLQQLEQRIEVAATGATAASVEATKAAVDQTRSELQAQVDANRAESQHRDADVRVKMAEISANLALLTEQLNKFGPARTVDVASGQGQLSSAVDARLEIQSQRMDAIHISAQEAHKTAQDTADVLQTLLVGMENLGESVRQLRDDMNTWGEPEDQAILDELVEEVPITSEPPQVSNSPSAVPLGIPPATVCTLPMPATLAELHDPSLGVLERRLAAIRMNENVIVSQASSGLPAEIQTSVAENKGQTDVPCKYVVDDIPASEPPRYPGLDGHPRRITPIAVAHIERDPQQLARLDAEMAEIWKQEEAKRGRGVSIKGKVTVPGVQNYADGKSAKTTEMYETTMGTQDQSNGTNRSMIGNTTIPPSEREKIREEVRTVMRQNYPGIQFGTIHNSGFGSSGANAVQMRDVGQTSVPEAIAGSEVSVASTSKNGGNAMEFSQLSQHTGAGSQPQMFATMQWKPKEPPCFYGRSSEDVHTWTSLVRHYLTFMGGSDAQQVAYSVTLLRENAHEWYMGYERRNRHPPRDWASLAEALLERFGSNIRAQEAQSQLMHISQGQRPVREYASQFELLMGRLISYDEGMLLNQFIWGLQPELARSVSLHYPKSIAQAVSLAETTELAVKASRRPVAKGSQSGRAPNNQNRGRGRWSNMRGRGNSGGRRGGGRRGGRGGQRSSTGSYDPLACYRCGVRGHLARDCPQNMQSQGSGVANPSRGKSFQSVQRGTRGRGRGNRQVRFSGLSVLYDDEGNQYPIDDEGQLYVPLDFGQTAADGENEAEKQKDTKN